MPHCEKVLRLLDFPTFYYCPPPNIPFKQQFSPLQCLLTLYSRPRSDLPRVEYVLQLQGVSFLTSRRLQSVFESWQTNQQSVAPDFFWVLDLLWHGQLSRLQRCDAISLGFSDGSLVYAFCTLVLFRIFSVLHNQALAYVPLYLTMALVFLQNRDLSCFVPNYRAFDRFKPRKFHSLLKLI